MSDRRRQILRAATEIAAERGFPALSVRNVATRAGIGASTLRHYFPTQRALFDAVAGPTFDAHLSDLRIHDSTVPPAHRLTECLAQFLPRHDREHAQLQQWLGLHAAALGPDRTDQARELLSVFTARARRRVEGWLGVLAEEGALRSPNRERHTTILLALVDGLCLHLLTPDATVTAAGARTLLADAVAALLTADPPAR